METLLKWRHTIELLGLAAIAGLVLTRMDADTWVRVERLWAHVVTDPMAAAGTLVLMIGAARTVWFAWKHDPNAPRVATTTVTHTETGKPEEKSE